MGTFALLLASRKFWVGSLSLAATFSVVLLRALDKIPADAMIPTMAAITATGLGVVSSIAWEDSSRNKVLAASETKPQSAPSQTVNVNAVSPADPVTRLESRDPAQDDR